MSDHIMDTVHHLSQHIWQKPPMPKSEYKIVLWSYVVKSLSIYFISPVKTDWSLFNYSHFTVVESVVI